MESHSIHLIRYWNGDYSDFSEFNFFVYVLWEMSYPSKQMVQEGDGIYYSRHTSKNATDSLKIKKSVIVDISFYCVLINIK